MANTFKFGNGQWAVKDGYALAYNDENGNFKPLPFDFTRATSATRVNKDGLIETVGSNEPRIDFLNDSNGALLLEPQRTNLVTYSDDFSTFIGQSGGTGILPIITINNVISPDGTLNADKIVFNLGGGTTASDQSLLYKSITIPTTTNYATSFWMKGDSGGEEILIRSVNGSTYTSFTLTTEWKRYYTIEAGTAGVTYPEIGLRQGVLGTINSTATVYLYGAQLEAGSYPTSIINTSGSAVTRVAEICNNSGNDQVINSTEGVLYWNIITQDSNSSSKAISINNGINTILSIYFYSSSINVIFNVNGVNQFYGNFGLTIGQEYKVAVLYQENNFALYVNGVKRAEDTNGSVPSVDTFDRLDLSEVSVSNFYGNVKDVRLYNTALTDAELIELTTI